MEIMKLDDLFNKYINDDRFNVNFYIKVLNKCNINLTNKELLEEFKEYAEMWYILYMHSIEYLVVGHMKSASSCIYESIADIIDENSIFKTHGFLLFGVYTNYDCVVGEGNFNAIDFYDKYYKDEPIDEFDIEKIKKLIFHSILGGLVFLHLVDNNMCKIIFTIREPISQFISSVFFKYVELPKEDESVLNILNDDDSFYYECCRNMDRIFNLITVVKNHKKLIYVSLDLEDVDVCISKISNFIGLKNFKILKNINVNRNNKYTGSKFKFDRKLIEKIYKHKLIDLYKSIGFLDNNIIDDIINKYSK